MADLRADRDMLAVAARFAAEARAEFLTAARVLWAGVEQTPRWIDILNRAAPKGELAPIPPIGAVTFDAAPALRPCCGAAA